MTSATITRPTPVSASAFVLTLELYMLREVKLQRSSEAEEDEQIDSGALRASERRSRDERIGVGERRPQPKDARQVVLDRRLVVRLGAELPAEPGDHTRRQLTADGDAGPLAEGPSRF